MSKSNRQLIIKGINSIFEQLILDKSTQKLGYELGDLMNALCLEFNLCNVCKQETSKSDLKVYSGRCNHYNSLP